MQKRIWCSKTALLTGLCSLSLLVNAQISQEKFQHLLSDEKQLKNIQVKFSAQVRELYAGLNYKIAWMGDQNATNRLFLLNQLSLAANRGLEEKDYQYEFISSFRKGAATLSNLEDTLQADTRFSDAAIHFYNDISSGNTKPQLGYNGLKYNPACRTISMLLKDALSANLLDSLASTLSFSLPEVDFIEKKIRWMNVVMTDSNFKEVVITSSKVNMENKPLLNKLYQLGILDSIPRKISDSLLKQRVKECQRQFNLLADGTLRSTALTEFNVALSVRWQQLKLAINYYRWLHCLTKNQSVIVVNIPAAYLKVYQKTKVVLEMRIIGGKKSTPTPTLASTIDQVILYPYWHVPYSIATKELLPELKRNPGLINAGNYQVLNSAGKIMDPYSINWQALSTKYFPYIIRQSTGCDNALGLLKLDFYSPFGVYLHDTPKKGLFALNKRFFSHGCMRMEKPMELGHLVLKNNGVAIDTLEQKGCLRNQSPIFVKANDHMAVIVWYNPVWIDITGRVIFYEDIYEKFTWKN